MFLDNWGNVHKPIFSVDMVRMQTIIYDDIFQRFHNEYLACNSAVNYYNKTRLQDYYHNYKINESYDLNLPVEFEETENGFSVGQNNFYLAFYHNNEQRSKFRHNLVIEFNPNKCSICDGLLSVIINRFFNDLSEIQLKSCDVAIDLFDIPIDNMVCSKGLKRSVYDFNTTKGRTLYIGERGSHGRIKIYDKAKERGIKDKIWTRWEVTLKLDLYLAQIINNLIDFEVNLPVVYFMDNMDMNSLEPKLRSAILCITNDLMLIDDFKWDFKQKIKAYLGGMSSLKIDDEVKPQLIDTIITYFKSYSSSLHMN
jgi:hypothetical protein